MHIQRKRKIWIALAAALLLFFLARFFDVSPVKGAVMRALFPATAMALRTSNGAAMLARALLNFKNSEAENALMREDVRQLASEQAQRAELEKENNALRKQLGVESRNPYVLRAAQIAYFDPLSFSYFAVIDKGSRDGIRKNMPVVMAGNVVFGKVAEVYDGFSRVMLIADADNAVSVKTVSEKASGVLAGADAALLRMDLIEKNADIAEGETVVTAGLDGAYPRGLVVGRVQEVIAEQEGIFKQARVRPAYEEEFTTAVFIITDYLQ